MEIFVITESDYIYHTVDGGTIISWHSTYENALEEKKVLSKNKKYLSYSIKTVKKGHVRPKTRPPGVPDTRETDGQD